MEKYLINYTVWALMRLNIVLLAVSYALQLIVKGAELVFWGLCISLFYLFCIQLLSLIEKLLYNED